MSGFSTCKQFTIFPNLSVAGPVWDGSGPLAGPLPLGGLYGVDLPLCSHPQPLHWSCPPLPAGPPLPLPHCCVSPPLRPPHHGPPLPPASGAP
eukprot:3396074-Rhodomonas_salina.2